MFSLTPLQKDALMDCPNQGIFWEILEKNLTGTCVTLSNGSILISESCNDPFAVILGELCPKSATEASEILRHREWPRLFCAPQWQPLFLSLGWQFHARARLNLVAEPQKPVLPPELSIQHVSERETFQRCFWFHERQKLYGGVDNFLAHGRAYVLIGPEQAVLSECYASIGGGHSEIGVVTDLQHRGKGYATMLLAEAISLLKQEQLCVDWSCNLDNQASLRSAFKLGFELQCHDMFMVPCRGNISST